MLYKEQSKKIACRVLTICSAFLLQGCGEKIDARQTQVIQGLVYKLNASDPFTGTVINAPSIGQKVLTQFGNGNCTVKFKDGVREGTSTCVANNGTKVSEINLTANELDGQQKEWDENGKLLLVVNWRNGKAEGLEEHFNPANGKPTAQTNWSNGLHDGMEKEWDPTGEKLVTDLVWNNGKATGHETLFDEPNGGYNEYILKDGQPNGVHNEYFYSNGRGLYLRTVENYKMGKLDGESKILNEDGSAYSSTNYKDGALDGLLVKYDTKGTMWDKQLYKNGILVSYLKDGAMIDEESKSGSSDHSNECLNSMIAKFHFKNGSDAAISDDMMQEWKGTCLK